jgi:hypothetical protein
MECLLSNQHRFQRTSPGTIPDLLSSLQDWLGGFVLGGGLGGFFRVTQAIATNIESSRTAAT